MRVCFYSSRVIAATPGGGVSVVRNLADALGALGVEVALHDYWRDGLAGYDLIHYFSCDECEIWPQLAGRGLPLVVTTISWHDWPLWLRARRRLGFELRALRRRTRDRRASGDPFAFPDHFFPNSRGEATFLRRTHALPPARMTIIPHGVHARFQHGDPRFFVERYGVSDFVLCVGRFESPRKNQLALIRALQSVHIPVVFIGGPEVGHEWYYEQCRAAAGPHMHFVPPIDHTDALLTSAYHAARVVVLPALLESPGLVGLEGAIAGAQVAVTQNGSAQEYLGDLAFYFDPRDPLAMRQAVLQAYDAKRDDRLRTHVLAHYTWERIAALQHAAYLSVLAARAQPTPADVPEAR